MSLALLTFHSDSFHPLSKSAAVRTKEVMKATTYCVLIMCSHAVYVGLIFNTTTFELLLLPLVSDKRYGGFSVCIELVNNRERTQAQLQTL